jgi:CRISPR-associated protein Csx17
MTLHMHTLKGCAPTPLANYLKALGILRLVAEQAEKQVRGWWQGEHFCLMTKLSREELETFFLEKYEPTPLLSPWNKGCGFFKADDPGLAPLETSQAIRFERFRRGVVAARHLLNAVAHADAVIRAIKARTKTNKTFQTEEQRQLLERSETYCSCLDQTRTQISKPDCSVDKRTELESEIVAIQSIVAPATKRPYKAEADRMKASSGYKRLLAAADRRFKSLKDTLIPNCRLAWRGPHADWLSAAVVLNAEGEPEWPSLLGTGGNDGNLDFTNNFMQQLGTLFDLASEAGGANEATKILLDNSLWLDAANQLTKSAVGQYQPGAAGGANSSTGTGGDSLVNPWDFVLMLEGSLLFTARATRRLDPNAFSRASAPFVVRPHAAGFATPGAEKAQRGEQWMPLWEQPATLPDVVALFGEARVQLKRQTANRPVDMARAISRLGVARGIEAFVRYGYLERNGQSTLAVPLCRVHVHHNPREFLIEDIAGWMNQLQRRSRDKNAPARLIQAERRLADAVFAALTHDYSSDRWQAILQAAAAIEAIQATGTAIEAGPIPLLHPEWASSEVIGDSCEVRLALALGSAADQDHKGRRFDPVRHHWLPLELGARRFKTAEKRLFHDPRVVMSGRDALADCSAIVERRLIEGAMKGQRRLPLIAARGCDARLDDLVQFLRGNVDCNMILSLARAFMAIDWNKWSPKYVHRSPCSKDQPEEAWLAIRLACLPWPLKVIEKDIPADPRIVRRLLAGDSCQAIDVALARLRAAGIRAPLQAGVTNVTSAHQWAAALVFPINQHDARRAAETLDPSLKGPSHA